MSNDTIWAIVQVLLQLALNYAFFQQGKRRGRIEEYKENMEILERQNILIQKMIHSLTVQGAHLEHAKSQLAELKA